MPGQIEHDLVAVAAHDRISHFERLARTQIGDALRRQRGGEPAMTRMEVGTLLSLSRERVRQIESSALLQLRKAMTRKRRRDRNSR